MGPRGRGDSARAPRGRKIISAREFGPRASREKTTRLTRIGRRLDLCRPGQLLLGPEPTHVDLNRPGTLLYRPGRCYVGREPPFSARTIFMSAGDTANFCPKLLCRPDNRQSALEYFMSDQTIFMSAQTILCRLSHLDVDPHHFQLGNELKHGNEVEVQSPS